MVPEPNPELENQIKACLNGEPDSFRYVFDAVKERIFQYTVSRTNNREDALDITQEIFIEIWKALPKFQYRSLGQFYGFIFLISRRRLIKYYRRHKHDIALRPNQKNMETQTQYQSNFNQYHDVVTGIKRLREPYQEVLRLHYWSGLTYEEIGVIIGVRESTVKVWHYRAVQKLKEILGQL
ncbi:MAG: hypothetical protein A3A24_03305 [Candidatus Buchananbacteria bacterium RIFCSPLOWO2_01_FULL_46_12]|uniref:HTH luxR-type domain-containing protein n=2 Tax=Candidatus Buchananiibacteriota TaxID=1817903 RepID=A0A1G1YSY6_9BACT|nr:MAG: hypothetical protein A2744_00790 [Candidatus Buchananbacteria bacterium RIFCSPHIGHO2_01_FULL_44_11]OGY54926.1 MAG: hypothetical protein A3A24_03305 [Candidatus Buchananbacteria bacterium RIFCSPLOWO2_01_FULL_46_12]